MGVVVPDNVLFEGGAGETIRRRLRAALEEFAAIAETLQRDRASEGAAADLKRPSVEK